MKEFFFSRDNFGEFFVKFAMYYRLGVIDHNTVIRLESFLASNLHIRNEILSGFKYYPDHPTRRLEFVYHGEKSHDVAELIIILSGLSLSRLELEGVRISGSIDLSSCITLGTLSLTNCVFDERLNNGNLIKLSPFVKELTLEESGLRTLPNLRSTRLEILNLSANDLNFLHLSKLPRTLDVLDVSFCNISEVIGDFDFPGLFYLSLEGNRLRRIPDVMVPSLKELNISDNSFSDLPQIHENLTHLYANLNLLISIPLWIASVRLETLEVEGNQLSSDWFRSLSIGDILCDEVV